VEVNPDRASYPKEFRGEPFEAGKETGLRVLEPDGNVRLVVLPTSGGRVSFSDRGNGIYGLAVNMDAKVGDQVDLLMPALPQPREEMDREMALGFDGALAKA